MNLWTGLLAALQKVGRSGLEQGFGESVTGIDTRRHLLSI